MVGLFVVVVYLFICLILVSGYLFLGLAVGYGLRLLVFVIYDLNVFLLRVCSVIVVTLVFIDSVILFCLSDGYGCVYFVLVVSFFGCFLY